MYYVLCTYQLGKKYLLVQRYDHFTFGQAPHKVLLLWKDIFFLPAIYLFD